MGVFVSIISFFLFFLVIMPLATVNGVFIAAKIFDEKIRHWLEKPKKGKDKPGFLKKIIHFIYNISVGPASFILLPIIMFILGIFIMLASLCWLDFGIGKTFMFAAIGFAIILVGELLLGMIWKQPIPIGKPKVKDGKVHQKKFSPSMLALLIGVGFFYVPSVIWGGGMLFKIGKGVFLFGAILAGMAILVIAAVIGVTAAVVAGSVLTAGALDAALAGGAAAGGAAAAGGGAAAAAAEAGAGASALGFSATGGLASGAATALGASEGTVAAVEGVDAALGVAQTAKGVAGSFKDKGAAGGVQAGAQVAGQVAAQKGQTAAVKAASADQSALKSEEHELSGEISDLEKQKKELEAAGKKGGKVDAQAIAELTGKIADIQAKKAETHAKVKAAGGSAKAAGVGRSWKFYVEKVLMVLGAIVAIVGIYGSISSGREIVGGIAASIIIGILIAVFAHLFFGVSPKTIGQKFKSFFKIVLIILVVMTVLAMSSSFLSTQSWVKSSPVLGPIFGTLAQLPGATELISAVWSKVLYPMFDSLWYAIFPKTKDSVFLANFKQKSCYPFCLSDSGENTKWEGLEVTALKIVPETLYDYQMFSVMMEITNNGNQRAKFIPQSQPTFGIGKKCKWTLSRVLTFSADPTDPDSYKNCEKYFPIPEELEDIEIYQAGPCTVQEDDTIQTRYSAQECELKPGEMYSMRWLGIDVVESEVPEGETFNPEVTISADYDYVPSTDVIGQLVIMDSATQLSGATDQKNIGRIANKISQSYSPTGPLMIALGTAETEVIRQVPTYIMMEFDNKGHGDLKEIKPENLRFYVPTVLKPLKKSNGKVVACSDFDLSKTVYYKDNVPYNYDPNTGEYSTERDDVDNMYQPFATGEWTMYTPNNPVGPIEEGTSRNHVPVLGCIFDTSNVPAEINAYTVKVRVLQYTYTESQTQKVQIIGTKIDATGAETS
jgi:MFS family permease